MVQPDKYYPAYSFSDFQSSNPATPLPAAPLDAELQSVGITTNKIVDNLALIQRDDGYLANASVGPDQLTGEVLVALNVTAAWLTGTAYTVDYLVLHIGNVYRCLIAHTSGTFATDLAAGKWVILLGAASAAMYDVMSAASHAAGRTALGSSTVGDALFISSTAAAARANIGSTTVGDAVFVATTTAVARTALGSTTVGDAVFIAANAAAARTALALGTMSTQAASAVAVTGGSVTTSTISGNLFGGDINFCSTQLDKTTSAALANIVGMVQTVVPGVYIFRASLVGTAGASGGWKVAFKLTTTVLSSCSIWSKAFTTAADPAMGYTTTTADQTTLLGATSAVATATIEGKIVVGTGGTMQLQFAQNVSDGTTCSIYVGSYMEFRRIS